MPEGGKRTDISPGVVARVAQAARYVINGVAPDAWFGPLQPLQPMAPSDVAGRRFDYPVGYNLDTRPRSTEGVTFESLRLLADSCDVLRSVIETRKDQMEALDWSIRVKGAADKRRNLANDEQKRRIDDITAFLQSPDKESTWSQWQRQLLEDMFVIDAATLYKRRDRKGRLYSLEVLDGATIKLLLDDTGRRPIPPDPAYQQILKGIPAVDYTSDELLYLMHNPRSHKVYGYGHVEQIIVTVNIAIRRALFQLDYYREGSLPDAFGTLPDGWTIDQIKAFQNHFDSMMSGNGANRRKLRFMPAKFDYKEAKQPPLKDEYDEWLARLICHIFSISPDPFVKQVNRATAETSHDRALKEGLAPLQRWMKGLIDRIIAEEFESADLEFAWSDDREMDPKQAADIRREDAKAGLISLDEAREEMGHDPVGGAASKPMVYTASGYVQIDPEERQQPGQAQDGQQPQDGGKEETGASEKPGQTDESGKQEAKTEKAAYSRLRKAERHKPIPFDRPATRKAMNGLKKKVAKVLGDAARPIAEQVRADLGNLAKDAIDDEINRQKGERIAAAIDLGTLDVLIDVVPIYLETVLADSGGLTLAQIGVTDEAGLVDQVNDRAVEYSRQRAAEMVGKRWVDGELVDNPDARWVISDATRDEIRSIVEQGLADNLGEAWIAEQIEKSFAFSGNRAELIAKTEIAKANSMGALAGYRAARDLGVKVRKAWLTDEAPCPVCVLNAEAGPVELDDLFPSGDDTTPAHPNCECALIPITDEDS